MKIQIVGWEKYRGRSDLVHPRWISFHKELFDNPKYFGMMSAELAGVFAYCCCMALGTDDALIEINISHVRACLQMDEKSFHVAIINLVSIQLVRVTEVITSEPVRDPYITRQDLALVGYNKVEYDMVPKDIVQSDASHLPAKISYLNLEEEIPLRKKKEKRQKVELLCEPIEALKGIHEIITARRIPTITQQKWVKLYHPAQILREIEKADLWAINKGEEKKNWAQFFTNWLNRAFSSPAFQQATIDLPKPEEPKKKSYLEEQWAIEVQRREQAGENQ